MSVNGEFSNEPLDVDGLPRLDDDDFVAVDARHLIPSFIALAVGGVAVVVITSLIAARVDRAIIPLGIGAVILLGLCGAAILTVIEMRRLAYQLREHDVSYRTGALSRSVATIPFARVQHVSISRGPFERWLGLATLGVNSAGPDLSIPGLTEDTAERLRSFIVTSAGLDDHDHLRRSASTAPAGDHHPPAPPSPTGGPLPPPPASTSPPSDPPSS